MTGDRPSGRGLLLQVIQGDQGEEFVLPGGPDIAGGYAFDEIRVGAGKGNRRGDPVLIPEDGGGEDPRRVQVDTEEERIGPDDRPEGGGIAGRGGFRRRAKRSTPRRACARARRAGF